MEETIVHRIIRLREAANLSQRQLAEKSGVAYGTIQSWEQNKEKIPSIKMIQMVAEALDAPPEYIIFGKTFGQTVGVEGLPETVMPKVQVKELITKLDKIYANDQEEFDAIYLTIHQSYRVYCELDERKRKANESSNMKTK